MTQFLVVYCDPNDLAPPAGIGVAKSSAELRELARRIVPDYDGPCARIVDRESGESDPLFDALHNHAVGSKGEVLMNWLEGLGRRGMHRIAMWCGTDTEEISTHDDWDEFVAAVRRDASRQPPEVWAVWSPSSRATPRDLS